MARQPVENLPTPSEPPKSTQSAPASGAQGRARALGLPSATALVIGSIVGTGVFTMPGVLAGAGTSSIVVLAVVSAGAMLLAVLFGQLTRRLPNSDGGLYAYAHHELGEFAGYLTAWCYWITAWAGNAAIVSSWVLYVEALFSITHPSAWTNFGIAMLGLWIPAAINLFGAREMAWFQNLTVVLKYLPLAVVGIVGWFFVKSANFGPFNATGSSLYSAIGIAAGVALFAFIGVEATSIAAARVRNPRRNVMRASVIGTAGCALLYILVTAAVMGLVPHHALVGNGAPFVDAFQSMFKGISFAGKLVAGVAVVSGLGSLNGWTLVTAEMPWAAAQDDLFIPQFRWTWRDGNPWFGILASTAVASALMGFAYSGRTGITVFTYLVDLSVVTVAIPYFFSAVAQVTYLVSGRRRVNGVRLVRDFLIAALSALFSLWITFTAGYQAVYQTVLLLLIGIGIYAWLKARRERLGEIPVPEELGPSNRPNGDEQHPPGPDEAR